MLPTSPRAPRLSPSFKRFTARDDRFSLTTAPAPSRSFLPKHHPLGRIRRSRLFKFVGILVGLYLLTYILTPGENGEKKAGNDDWDLDDELTVDPPQNKPQQTKANVVGLERGKDGLMRVGKEWSGRHPLFEIIEAAEKEWEARVATRPRTQEDAYESYTRAHGHRPPATYPRFFTLFSWVPPTCPLPPPTTLPLYAPLSPQMLRTRQTGLEGSPGTVTLTVKNGRVGANFVKDSIDVDQLRDTANTMVDVLNDLAIHLPDFRFTLTSAVPRNPMPYKLREEMEDLHSVGANFNDEAGDWDEDGDGDGVYTFRGWADGCEKQKLPRLSLDTEPLPAFVVNPPLSVCHHAILRTHSPQFASLPPKTGILHPLFGFSRTALHGDVVLPRPLPDAHPKIGKTKWEDKIGQLYWRGLAPFSDALDELAHPSNRLVNLLTSPFSTSPPADIIVPRGASGFKLEHYKDPREVLSGLSDVAFTGCEEGRYCEDLDDHYRISEDSGKEEKFKFVIDLDGEHGPSTKFRELLLTGSLVLKSTVFEDFATSSAQPWVHYVPVQPDFSDLPAILLFFQRHDDMAQKIAGAGRQLAQDCLGADAIKAATFEVFSEYGRMWEPNRKMADWVQ